MSLFMAFLLSGCVYAGDIGVVGARKNFFTRWNSYSAKLYNPDEVRLVNTEYLDEKNYKLNQSLTAYRGYSVFNHKTYRKDTYQSSFATLNKDGALSGNSVSPTYKKGQHIDLLGEVKIDGVLYRMVPTEDEGFVTLVDEEGRFYNRMAKLDGSRVMLLDTEYEVFPEDLRLIEVTNSSSRQTRPINGFDVKYDGVRHDRVWFTYLDYSGKEDGGKFENISFPNKPGLIEINGIGFRILQADDEHIDYMILKQ